MATNIKDTKEIYRAYETTDMDHPRITDSFAEAQEKKAATRENLSYKKAAPSAIAQALRTVYKNEGARFINHTSETLATLVNKALEEENIRCA